MENLYNKMLEKQELIKKDRYEKQKQYAREYYWKNREYVLERNRMKKYERSEYFKQWYEKNKKNLIDYKGQLIVTLGEKGVQWGDIIHPPSRKAEVSDLSGAGDTFFAAFIYYYLSHQSISKSIHFAQNCSLEVIEKKGVVIVENNLDT